MRFSFVRRSMLALTVVALNACHEPPQAPITHAKPGPDWIRITMDDGVTDYPSWGGLDLLSQADTEFDFVTVETEYGSLHYGGCVQNCQDPSRWLVGTIDSGVYRGLGPNASTIRTAGGIAVAYEDWQSGTDRVKIGTCGGACFLKSSWRLGDIRTGLLGSYYGTHSRALSVDPAGGLDVLYRGPNGALGIEYAHCASMCTDSASWQSLTLDSGGFFAFDDALTVGPSGRVHALVEGGSGNGLHYFECDSACTTSASWSSLQLDTGEVGATPSILVGPNGTLYVTYRSRLPGMPIDFATCSSNCLNLSNWSLTKLPATGSDVSLLLDAAGQPWVATTYGSYEGTTVILHCAAACASGGAWTSTSIASFGDGLDVALALDATGQPRVVVSGNGVHYAQRPDTTVLIH